MQSELKADSTLDLMDGKANRQPLWIQYYLAWQNPWYCCLNLSAAYHNLHASNDAQAHSWQSNASPTLLQRGQKTVHFSRNTFQLRTVKQFC